MSELVGLHPVVDELKELGGRVLAISVDPPKDSLGVVKKAKLEFPILSDETRETLEAYGLVHAGMGPGKSDIAMPAMVLVGQDGSILWRRKSVRVQDRPAPEEVLEAVRAAVGKP
ncbi:MAG: redoxin domain-containing protein [Planctomycetia bacterium]|nr:redoxin domain-containing protein [Planctomycetia bacterium]MCC7315188.1 redoxin domain-containing protein [Planctomycetota bacterium]